MSSRDIKPATAVTGVEAPEAVQILTFVKTLCLFILA